MSCQVQIYECRLLPESIVSSPGDASLISRRGCGFDGSQGRAGDDVGRSPRRPADAKCGQPPQGSATLVPIGLRRHTRPARSPGSRNPGTDQPVSWRGNVKRRAPGPMECSDDPRRGHDRVSCMCNEQADPVFPFETVDVLSKCSKRPRRWNKYRCARRSHRCCSLARVA